ncbi:MAG: Flp pilus assembly protein CpaB [Vicinamibacterales bacterium]
MNRTTRTLIVVTIAIAVASIATYAVFVALKSRPAREVEVAHAYQVVAARPLPVGTRVTPTDVKLVAWPAAALVPGGFTSVDQVIDRGLVSSVAENEPLNGNNVASKEAGAGLPPIIPPGMRAISVRVNEIIGVAGFVIQGTRVDVMAILRDANNSMARVVVSNVQVLAAGTNIDQDAAKNGQAIPSTVVTLLVTPDDAARIGLAAVEGQIMLTLRNPLDTNIADARGIRTANLRGEAAPPPLATAPAPTASVRRITAFVAPPPVPPAPRIYTVETIRAAKRTEETVK